MLAHLQQIPFAPGSLGPSSLLWDHPTPARALPPNAGLSGSSTSLSLRAVSSHPGEPNDCTQVSLHHRLQASPYQTGWPLPCSVTRPYRAKRQPAIEFTCVTARRFAAPGFGLGITPFTASLATCWTPIYHVDYFSYQ